MKIDYRDAHCILEMANELEFETTQGLPSSHILLVKAIFCEFPDLADEFEPLFRESR